MHFQIFFQLFQITNAAITFFAAIRKNKGVKYIFRPISLRPESASGGPNGPFIFFNFKILNRQFLAPPPADFFALYPCIPIYLRFARC